MAALTIAQARRIVEDHSHETFVRDGKLYALVVWTSREGSGRDEELVPLQSVSALRDWLGY